MLNYNNQTKKATQSEEYELCPLTDCYSTLMYFQDFCNSDHARI